MAARGRGALERWRRPVAGVACAILGGLVMIAVLLKHEPALVAGAARSAGVERSAARMVTKGAALHAAVSRPGPWGAAFADHEINAWLEVDQPLNHPNLLPEGISRPRVRFRPQRVEAVVRLGTGPLSAFVWCDLEVVLRGVNQLQITVHSATVGAVPVPTALILAEIARGVATLGVDAQVRRLDGRMALVVYIPGSAGRDGPQWRLDSLRIDDGEMIVAGESRAGGSEPPGPARDP